MHSPVGAAAGCDLLILFFRKQDQKIAACGSSYRVIGADQAVAGDAHRERVNIAAFVRLTPLRTEH